MGTVIIWPAATDPTNGIWLECNGQSTDLYPALATIIGNTVPDYRGLFLRGYGNQAYAQNNGSIIGVTSTMYASGSLGTIQGDSIRNIAGTYYGGIDAWINVSGAFYSAGGNSFMGEHGSVDYDNPILGIDSSRVVPTSNENRPVNIAVRYLIKAK